MPKNKTHKIRSTNGLSTSEHSSLKRVMKMNRNSVTRNMINRARRNRIHNATVRSKIMKQLMNEGYNNIMKRSLAELIKEKKNKEKANIEREKGRQRLKNLADWKAEAEARAIAQAEARAIAQAEARAEEDKLLTEFLIENE